MCMHKGPDATTPVWQSPDPVRSGNRLVRAGRFELPRVFTPPESESGASTSFATSAWWLPSDSNRDHPGFKPSTSTDWVTEPLLVSWSG